MTTSDYVNSTLVVYLEPCAIIAIANTSSGVKITWDAITDSSKFIKYYVYRKTGSESIKCSRRYLIYPTLIRQQSVEPPIPMQSGLHMGCLYSIYRCEEFCGRKSEPDLEQECQGRRIPDSVQYKQQFFDLYKCKGNKPEYSCQDDFFSYQGQDLLCKNPGIPNR